MSSSDPSGPQQIAELYARESGRTSEAAVYAGSSDGSRAFGVRTVVSD